MHEVLVNCLGGLSLPRKSVVRLTDRPDMTLDVYRGRKTIQQQLTGNKLEADVGDIVSLQAQTSPYFQLREKFKCIEHIDKSAPSIHVKPLPETRKSIQKVSRFQIPTLNPD